MNDLLNYEDLHPDYDPQDNDDVDSVSTDYCVSCSGSGEGMYDDSTCSTCKGKGVF